MSDESKKTAEEGRSMSHAAAGPAADLLGGLAAIASRQRGPGKRSAEFVQALAARHGMLPGMLLADTLMHGLRDHLAAEKPAGEFLVERARTIAKSLSLDSGEALQLLLGVAKELMPYVHQKQPMAVDVDVRAIMFAAVTQDGGPVAPGAGRRDLRPADVREMPAITGVAVERSDAHGRTAEPTALEGKDE